MAETTDLNIVLIGFSGTGKSLVARGVARRLGWQAIDTDDEIVKLAGKPIPEIFAKEGEKRFREMESQVLQQACAGSKTVIATGGGAIINEDNRKLMFRNGVVICLEAGLQTIHRRLSQNSRDSNGKQIRPLLIGDDPMQRIEQLKSSRQPYYAMADWTVRTDELSLEQVADEVVRVSKYLIQPTCQVTTTTQQYSCFVGRGWLRRLGGEMHRVGLSGSVFIISDLNVFHLYGQTVSQILDDAGFKVVTIVVPPGESTKSLDAATEIYDSLVEYHAERGDSIVALGGGMVGDLAGFIAATYLRGVPLVQIPTSLIAMVDASIGGKVAVNHPKAKNIIGAFYQPRMVLADTNVLASLPKRELISGWAEVVKHGLILDADYFCFLEQSVDKLLKLESEATTMAVARSAAIKAMIVTEDEKEQGRRTLLNYGHTVGHGLESAGEYERFLHGEAVSIGMMAAAHLSQRLGMIPAELVERQGRLLEKLGLPTYCTNIDKQAVLTAMELDKKVQKKSTRWVLLEGLGQAVVRRDVPHNLVLAALDEVIR
jgi:shikimate kinase / 3-dehydroquinate synthase